MAFDKRYMTQTQAAQATMDVGLRDYMLKVYNYMASGLALTGIVAWFVASSPAAMSLIFGTPLKWVLLFGTLGLVFFFSARLHALSHGTAQALFWLYAGLNGAVFSSIFAVYTGESIARVFFITAATFAGMSLYGYTTKRDLTGMGSFLMMGLWGLIIASVVNIFMHSAMLTFMVSAAGVLIFTGLTAYDSQKIKEMYLEADDDATTGKKALMGALALYLDFINLFLSLLQLMGDRR